MRTSLQMAGTSLIGLAVFGLLLFLPAGTFIYWQAWVFIAVFTICTLVPSIYLLIKNPAGAPDACGARGGNQVDAEDRRHRGVHVVARGDGVQCARPSLWVVPGTHCGVVDRCGASGDRARHDPARSRPEQMLRQELDGYDEYAEKVLYRLMPYVW